MRALVTGGSGFIGSHLGVRLAAEGYAVRVLDNLSSGKRANLAHIRDVDFREADVRDAAAVDAAVEGCDLVFHEAAVVSVPYSVEHPQETHDVNIQGTLNVLMAARKHRVRRVVFASSAAVYGEEPTLPKHEAMAPEPITPYGVEKLAGEAYLRTWSKVYGVETVALRYFNVFGVRQDPTSAYSGVISVFADRALSGKPITVYGDGEQSRDFIDVRNVVEANWLAATTKNVSGRIYNVAMGRRTTLNDLLRMLGRIVGRELVPTYAAARVGDIRDSLADVSAARKELGFAPTVDVEVGLADLVSSLRG